MARPTKNRPSLSVKVYRSTHGVYGRLAKRYRADKVEAVAAAALLADEAPADRFIEKLRAVREAGVDPTAPHASAVA